MTNVPSENNACSECDSLTSFCTYTPHDKQNRANNQFNETSQYDILSAPDLSVHSDILSSELSKNNASSVRDSPTNFCTYISNDKQNSASNQCYDTSQYDCSSAPSLSAQVVQKNIKINRNPPLLTKEAWELIDTEFANLDQNAWDQFRTKHEEPENYVGNLNKTLSKFLLLKPEFQKDIKVFYEKTKKKPDALEEIRLMKNDLNKKAKQTDATNEEKKDALETIRLYNHMKKLQTEKDTEKQMREEEKLYRKDFWSSARNVTNGTFGTQSSQPTFEKSTADEYY